MEYLPALITYDALLSLNRVQLTFVLFVFGVRLVWLRSVVLGETSLYCVGLETRQ